MRLYLFCGICGSLHVEYLVKPITIYDSIHNDIKCQRCGHINSIKYSSPEDRLEVEYNYLERINYEIELEIYLNPVLE